MEAELHVLRQSICYLEDQSINAQCKTGGRSGWLARLLRDVFESVGRFEFISWLKANANQSVPTEFRTIGTEALNSCRFIFDVMLSIMI